MRCLVPAGVWYNQLLATWIYYDVMDWEIREPSQVERDEIIQRIREAEPQVKREMAEWT